MRIPEAMTPLPSCCDPRQALASILDAGLRAADPAAAVRNALRVRDGALTAGGASWPLGGFRRIFVLGAGKASAVMAAEVEAILAERVSGGVVCVKYGHAVPLKRLSVREAGHPVPDESGLAAAREIAGLAAAAQEGDLVVCCLSGGASALLPLPASGLTLADKQQMTRLLLSAGAGIDEINAVRKHLSDIKGGRLARLVAPATLLTLVLSDVVGDDLSVIASGPTTPDPTTFADCLAILERRRLLDRAPASVQRRLRDGAAGRAPETPKPGDPAFARVHNTLVGSNALAIAACRARAEALGYRAMILSTTIQGETRDVARMHGAIAREVIASGSPLAAPCCILSGGETTITLRGQGKGGRNQEFALAFAIEVDGLAKAHCLSAGTDGTDGPTDAAGAFADGDTCSRARRLGLDPDAFLDNNDSYAFFSALGDLLVTGPTRTNVMDIRAVILA